MVRDCDVVPRKLLADIHKYELRNTIMQTYSVREIAKFLKRTQHHVLRLIHSGDLEAVNVAAKSAKKPNWRITDDAYSSFLRTRSTRPDKKPPRRKRRDIRKMF